ncbi:MAG: Holliday junction branch migration protein RuvA [Selenomonadaceae bacterium]|nr:Holliday junction branch migration protein RuvA [Selenomonadaceae bacterium]
MLAFLSGKIKFLFPDACVLDVHGIGFKIFLDAASRQNLSLGAHEEFFIHTAVSEHDISLFGMKNQSAFDLFELLLTVSGIGSKSALAIVSKISAAEFARAVSRQDLKTLTKLPGVGKKSAERILLELKDKVQSLAENSSAKEFQPAQIFSNAQDEAAEALEALGYTASEISAAFEKAPENSSTEQLVKFALKELNRFA